MYAGSCIIILNVTESVKTGLICTSKHTSLNFSCELANNTKLASFIVLYLVSVVSNLYAYSLPTR